MLRVLTRTLTVADGDVDAVRMVDILDRSVERLADVTRELDRDSAAGRPHSTARRRSDFATRRTPQACSLMPHSFILFSSVL